MEETHNTNVFYAIIASFFSKKLYIEVITQWRKKIFLYLLVLLVIALIPMSIRVSLNIEKVTRIILTTMTKELPVLTITNGVATSKPAGVYSIDYPGSKHLAGIYDTQEQYKHFDTDGALFLIGKKGCYVKFSQREVKFYPYPNKGTVTVGAKQIDDAFNQHKKYIWDSVFLLLYTVGLVTFYVLYLIYASLLGVFSSFCAHMFNRELRLQQNFRLTMVAMTPSILIFCVLYLFNWVTLPIIALLILLQFIYVGFAVCVSRFALKKKK